ncbi:hypothetical protein KA539_002411, partial [Listeria monocytogenes]|nr:hypothetical protein [Listeria monocytogenes]
MAKLNQTDEAWERLFEKYNILEVIERDGVFIISAQQIKEYREARLMTKFDHKANLPNLFKNNDLSILPNSRGTYVIGKFNAYQQLVVDDKKPISVEIPYYIESFDNLSITSESTALNVAHFTGMIDMVMETGNDEPNSVLTLSGRMSSGEIQYQIKGEKNFSYDFNVNNSQIEIDGSYENLQKIALIEAKSKLPLDFHIRQLYYPYRVYSNLIQKKEIMPVFFTFADDIFSFHIYKFNDLNDYNSIQKVEQFSFILNTVLDLNINEVKKISCNSPQLHSTEGVPFPQANSMGRILSILEYIKIPMNKNELAKICEFDIRQSDYYSNALIYLGFAKRNEKSEFVHTQLGSKISKMANNNERNKIIIESILKFKIFKKIF